MADLIRVRAQITGFTGGPGLMTQYFTGSTSATTAEVTEALARVRACWEQFKSQIPSTVTVVYSSSADLLDPATGRLTGTGTGTLPVATVGAGANISPPQNAVVGQSISNVIINGRRVRGHTFFAPLCLAALANTGVPSTTALNQAQSAMQALGTTLVTPIVHVVWHRPKNFAGGAACAVNAYGTMPKVGVIRSRRD